jgi:polysaccharide biosynthesis PFTS motif protein
MLALGNLPKKFNHSKSYDVISWYLQWEKRASDVEMICHGVPNVINQVIDDVEIHSQSEPLPSIETIKSCVKYFYWCCFAILLTTFDCLRGRWWYAFLLNQAALSAQVRCLKKESLALDYLFHNSGPIYRPLWTYDAERLGSRIIFYFYSTNSEYFSLSRRAASIPYGWKAMSWPYYLVWDKGHENFIKKSVSMSYSMELVGPIWFNDSKTIDTLDLKNMIAVFDVQPMRDSFYQVMGQPYEYYIPDVANAFILNIQTLSLGKNLNIVLKRKRNVGNRLHPSYRKVIENISGQSNFYEIDAEISPWHVIANSRAVVSMPFTSTALIARHLGKPSVYYDPTGLLRKDDPAAHNIPVLSSLYELNNWLDMVQNLDLNIS